MVALTSLLSLSILCSIINHDRKLLRQLLLFSLLWQRSLFFGAIPEIQQDKWSRNVASMSFLRFHINVSQQVIRNWDTSVKYIKSNLQMWTSICIHSNFPWTICGPLPPFERTIKTLQCSSIIEFLLGRKVTQKNYNLNELNVQI